MEKFTSRRATKITHIRPNKTRRAYLICIRKTQIESPCVMIVAIVCIGVVDPSNQA